MGAAGDHHQTVVAGPPARDPRLRSPTEGTPRGAVAGRPVRLVEGRHVNHPRGRRSVFDECDVHREFVVAADELSRAVERVDEEERPTLHLGNPAGRGRLFRDHRDVRRAARQAVEDDALSPYVGLGHGRGVGLVRHGEVGAVHV